MQTFSGISLQMNDTIMTHLNIASWEVVTLSTGWACLLSITLSERPVMSSGKLSPMELPEPKARDWKRIADGFYSRWNFPNCLGALDGKHIVMQVPPKSGSQFFNYKGTFSVVLMALVDDDYRFTCVDIRDYGSNSDRAVFKNCIWKSLYE